MNSAAKQLSHSRRNFLRGNVTNRVQKIRPPWAIDETQFLKQCTACDDCLRACPESIISRDQAGLPVVNFSHSGCTFCAECLESCSTGALKGLRSDIDQAWHHRMQISDNCLSVSAIVCRACGDHCEENAISFTLLTRGRSLPEINTRLCTGCGQCIPVCPANAISIHENLEGSL